MRREQDVSLAWMTQVVATHVDRMSSTLRLHHRRENRATGLRRQPAEVGDCELVLRARVTKRTEEPLAARWNESFQRRRGRHEAAEQPMHT